MSAMNTAAAALIAGRTATTIRKWVRQERLVASVRRTDGPPGFALDITEEALAAAIADLSRANLTGAYLAGADLTGADLTGADLSRANLTEADLRWAKGLKP